MLKRVLSESLRLEMTWRLALSALVCSATIAAATVTYAYSRGNDVLHQSEQQTELLLRNYIPYSIFMEKWDQKTQRDQANHQEIIERLIHLEEVVGTGKRQQRGHH